MSVVWASIPIVRATPLVPGSIAGQSVFLLLFNACQNPFLSSVLSDGQKAQFIPMLLSCLIKEDLVNMIDTRFTDVSFLKIVDDGVPSLHLLQPRHTPIVVLFPVDVTCSLLMCTEKCSSTLMEQNSLNHVSKLINNIYGSSICSHTLPALRLFLCV